MRDLFAPGDMIIARVQHQADGLARLSTVGSRYGVIQASCSRCGEPLHLRGRQLECIECGNYEKRKLSQNYGQLPGFNATKEKTPAED